MPVIEKPVINAVRVEIAAPSAGFMLGRDKLGTGKLGGSSVTWTPYLGAATELDIKRGGKRSGVSLSIDVGTLSMTLLNAGNPTTDGAVRPNTPIRVVLVATGRPLFTGRLLDVDMTHIFDKETAQFNTYVGLTAVDGVTDHANTKRYGAIAPAGYETWESRIRRLSMSSRAPIAAPAVEPARVVYALPTANVTDPSSDPDGWRTYYGPGVPATGSPRAAFRANATRWNGGFVGAGSAAIVWQESYYVGSNPANDWYDPAEGRLAVARVVTGLVPGRMYRVRTRALVGMGSTGFGSSTEGQRANNYRIFVEGVGVAPAVRMALSESVAYEMPAFEFVATTPTITTGLELTERVNGLTGNGGYVEQIGISGFVVEEIVSAAAQMLGSTIYESTLANHFDLACASVDQGRWWVDAAGVTQFRAGPITTDPVATFSDVRPGSGSGRTSYAWTGVADQSPSTETANGVTRTNRAIQPMSGRSLFAVAGSRVALSLGDGFVRGTVTDATAGANAQRIQVGRTTAAPPAVTVVPGEVIPFSVELRNSNAMPMSVYVYWYNAGAFLSVNALTQDAPAGSVDWTRFDGVVVPPAGANSMFIYFGNGRGNVSKVGGTIDARRLMIGDAGLWFDGSFPTTPNEYIDLSTSFDSRNVVNDLTLKDKGVQLNDKGETVELATELQVIEPTSIATWGTRAADVEVTIYDEAGFTGALGRHAASLLGQTSTPTYTLNRLEWNAAEDPDLAGLLDVHSLVTTTFRGQTQRSRIISVKHTMTPTRHLVTIDLVRI